LIKVGGRPGIPVEVVLTQGELAVNDTNKQWRQRTGIEFTETESFFGPNSSDDEL
jgi:hypothetical protein